MSPLSLALPEAGLRLLSDWRSLRLGCSPLRLGLPEGKAVSPLRVGLPEEGQCIPSDRLGLPEGRAVSHLRLMLPEAGLCLPSDWGSPQTGTP